MKAVFQLTYLLEVADEEEAFRNQQDVEQAMRLNFLAVLEQNGLDIEDADGVFEYLGTNVMMVREKAGL